MNIYAEFYTISTDSVLAVPLRYRSFLYESGDYTGKIIVYSRNTESGQNQDTKGAFRKPTSIRYMYALLQKYFGVHYRCVVVQW